MDSPSAPAGPATGTGSPSRADAPFGTPSSVRAVRTTGIYCRPGCAARPDPANVTTYPLAAAAEAAGYRACHRCRPYRESTQLGAIGADLVCTAVQMITAGALDDSSEEELAARLGVSARHLRRVFGEHLGVTPDRLARSHRAHFARRLLDDSDLPVRDVAFAAGYGSVRQFQRECTDTFGAPPSELRARRPRGSPRTKGTDGGLRITLPHRGRLDWDRMVEWLAARSVAGVERAEARRFSRTIDVDGQVGMLQLDNTDDAPDVAGAGVRGAPTGDRPVSLTAHLPHWDGLTHVVRSARRLVAAELDLDAASAHLGSDPLLGPLVGASPGLRPPGCWDPFETTIRAVIAQQITTRGARTIAGRMAERLGTPVEGLDEYGLHRIFPGPVSLLEGDLDGIGLTGSRIATVRSVAAAALDGLEFHGPDVVERLGELRGIGDWTAQYVAMRMGEPDAFPASDVALREAVGRLRGTDRLGTRELRELSQRWTPWRSLAAMHLWCSLGADTRTGA